MTDADRKLAASPAARQSAAAPTKRARIVDAGERFQGARKFVPKAAVGAPREGARAGTPRLADEWPRPDFRRDALTGRVSAAHAAFYLALYANLRPKAYEASDRSRVPQDYWNQWYRAGVAFLRQAYEQGRNTTREELREAYFAHMRSIAPADADCQRLAPHALGRGKRRLLSPLSLSWSLSVRASSLVDLGWPHDERVSEKETYGVDKLICEGVHAAKTGWYALWIQGEGYRLLDQTPRADRESAVAVLKARVAELLTKRAAAPPEKRTKAIHPARPHLDRPLERSGPDWRRGREVTADLLLEHFRFRGIEFGNWLSQSERQGLLDTTFDSLSDLCDLFGLPPSFASLGGRLGLAFGSRGRGFLSGAAHFEPKDWILHLTKTSGSGAIAHEFGHALDAYLHWRNWPQGLPGHKSTFFSSIIWLNRRPSAAGIALRDAFLEEPAARLWDAIAGAGSGNGSRFIAEARQLDGRGKRKPYWMRPTELFARCFEAWVADRLEDQDRKNEFLAQGCERDTDPKIWGLAHDPFPQGRERVEILAAMDHFIGTAATRWRAQAAARAG